MFVLHAKVERAVSLALLLLVHLSCLLVFAVPFRWSLVALTVGG
jgi:hypothetical protein